VFAVVGVWDIDPSKREVQQEYLEGIVAGVGRLPGLVKGYWSDGTDPRTSHTFIVFSERDAAERFAAEVRGNLENQAAAGVTNVSLDLTEVIATT
jgi:hypothetical protein